MGVCLDNWRKKDKMCSRGETCRPFSTIPVVSTDLLIILFVNKTFQYIRWANLNYVHERACYPLSAANFQQQQQKVRSIKYASSHLFAIANTSEHLFNFLCC